MDVRQFLLRISKNLALQVVTLATPWFVSMALLLPALALADLQQDRVGRVIISEIADLDDGEVIPKNIVKHYAPRLVAESLVYRMTKTGKPPVDLVASGVTSVKFDPMASTEVQLFFGERALANLKSSGFLNQHQTGHASLGAAYEPKRRAKIENWLSGLKLERFYSKSAANLAHWIRPKYAIVQINPDVGVSFGGREMPGLGSIRITDETGSNRWININGDYGPITAVLHDHVKNRVTVSSKDSLGISKKEARSEIHPLLETQVSGYRPSNYLEAQIWGPLDLRDVKEFRVDSARITQAALQMLVDTNLPVYEAKYTFGGRYVYTTNGALISSGSSEQISQNARSIGEEREKEVLKANNQIIHESLKDRVQMVRENFKDRVQRFCSGLLGFGAR